MGKIIPPGMSIPDDAIQQELEKRDHFRECVEWHGLLTPEAAEPIIQKAAKWAVLSDIANSDANAAWETPRPQMEDYPDVESYFAAYRIWLRPLRRWHMYSRRYVELLDKLFLSPRARFEEMERRTKRHGFGTN
jgi:hypothetical protein